MRLVFQELLNLAIAQPTLIRQLIAQLLPLSDLGSGLSGRSLCKLIWVVKLLLN
jgi:hypothetical protein